MSHTSTIRSHDITVRVTTPRATRASTVVQTLHNYRLLCPSSVLFRDGHICEDCLGRAIPWDRGVVPRVLSRGTIPRERRVMLRPSCSTAPLRQRGRSLVDGVYVAVLTGVRLGRSSIRGAGCRAESLWSKPNVSLADDPGRRDADEWVSGVLSLFVGRLAAREGVRDTPACAWASFARRYRLEDRREAAPRERCRIQLPSV
jgi:hypothetical protein